MTNNVYSRVHLIIAIYIGLCFIGCRQSATELAEDPETPAKTPRFASSSSAAGFVDDALCIDCHQEIHTTFQHVGMGKSFYRLSPDRIIEDFTNNHFFHEPSNRHYEMIQRGDDVYQRRYQLDANGEQINVLEQKVDWVIGSGNYVRTYVYQNNNGEMYELPLHWYTRLNRWDMGPGYEKRDHKGFSRRITRDCMFCHNAYPEFEEESDQIYQPHLFPKKLPQGIGCQRCHGPGREHIEAMESHDGNEPPVDTYVVNPANLEPELRDAVCFQCHLQPNSVFNSLVRTSGHGDYAFLPGQSLEDYLVAIDFQQPQDPKEHFQINHHGYRLQQSRCFSESKGALGCTTCHDPHVKLSPEKHLTHYRNACLQCHEVQACGEIRDQPVAERESSDCIACHMPERRTNDVILVSLTDHLITREVPSGDEFLKPVDSFPVDFPDVTATLLKNGDSNGLDESLYLAMGKAVRKSVADVKALEHLIEIKKPETIEPHWYLLGTQIDSGLIEDAVQTAESMLERFPDIEPVHYLSGEAFRKSGQNQRAKEQLSTALEKGYDTPEVHLALGDVLLKLGERTTAKRHLEIAISQRPEYYAALEMLGKLSLEDRQLDTAFGYLKKALEVNPLAESTYFIIGMCLLADGKPAEAERFLQHGANETGSTDLQETVVVAQLDQSKLVEALVSIEKISNGDPTIPFLVKAIVQAKQGHNLAANESLEMAQKKMSAKPSKVRNLLLRKARSAVPAK